ncbi:hypothetical protein C2E20_7879 [Micractinium conductrix]|uniref:RING-type domain-containing protein n=1 Tax=Micractinium conductrix TaxID=554055 RepID=A0A2P6V372_9CHLO|nr:hypothetical protein C2E20_7879 [Micractinium conductrix]|eukprot:PSC68540.1 hypothetical protein C2E20_7879 [Micractinium conductrix]
MAPRHVAARAAPDAAQHPAAAAQQEHPAPDFAAVVGTAGCRLGVVAADLLAEELPPESARRAALAAAGPALEAALRRRCADVAAACGYASTDHSGLPDHIRQLQAAAEGQQAAQAETWRSAAEQAGEAVALLARASELLARILRQHKLATQKEANSAQAAALHAACLFFREKLRVVEFQLKEVTYTASTVPVLRRIAVEVEAAVGAAAAALQQATARLAHYRALGPGFEALADEHGSVLEALEEAEYELREIEQFRALGEVTGPRPESTACADDNVAASGCAGGLAHADSTARLSAASSFAPSFALPRTPGSSVEHPTHRASVSSGGSSVDSLVQRGGGSAGSAGASPLRAAAGGSSALLEGAAVAAASAERAAREQAARHAAAGARSAASVEAVEAARRTLEARLRAARDSAALRREEAAAAAHGGTAGWERAVAEVHGRVEEARAQAAAEYAAREAAAAEDEARWAARQGAAVAGLAQLQRAATAELQQLQAELGITVEAVAVAPHAGALDAAAALAAIDAAVAAALGSADSAPPSLAPSLPRPAAAAARPQLQAQPAAPLSAFAAHSGGALGTPAEVPTPQPAVAALPLQPLASSTTSEPDAATCCSSDDVWHDCQEEDLKAEAALAALPAAAAAHGPAGAAGAAARRRGRRGGLRNGGGAAACCTVIYRHIQAPAGGSPLAGLVLRAALAGAAGLALGHASSARQESLQRVAMTALAVAVVPVGHAVLRRLLGGGSRPAAPRATLQRPASQRDVRWRHLRRAALQAADEAAAAGSITAEEAALLQTVMQHGQSRTERVRAIAGVLEWLRRVEADPGPQAQQPGFRLLSALVVAELNALVDSMEYEELYAVFGGPPQGKGLEEGAIAALSATPLTPSSIAGLHSPECPVCLSAFEAGDTARELGCRHAFHAACLDPWLRSNALCPVCRADVRAGAGAAGAAAAGGSGS